MATPAGFEPATIRLEGECSIQLSYGAIFSGTEPVPHQSACHCHQDRRDVPASLDQHVVPDAIPILQMRLLT